MKRNDIHRPSAINPDEYTFVGFQIPASSVASIGDCHYLNQQRSAIEAHFARTGGTWSNHEHGGNCHICGASAIYIAVFHHAATNAYIRTGEDCAEKLDFSSGDFNGFRRAVGDAREARAGKAKAQAILTDAGLQAAWAVYAEDSKPRTFGAEGWIQDQSSGQWLKADGSPVTQEDDDAYWARQRDYDRAHKQESIIADIVGKLVKYGSISPAQENLLRKLLAQIQERPAREAARAEQHAAAADCPSGRIQFEGTVLSVKYDADAQFPCTKILVQHASGYKLWGTRPSIQGKIDPAVLGYEPTPGNDIAYYCAEVGDRISFKATVTPSDKDAKFGFYSRPTGGKLVAQHQQEGVAA